MQSAVFERPTPPSHRRPSGCRTRPAASRIGRESKNGHERNEGEARLADVVEAEEVQLTLEAKLLVKTARPRIRVQEEHDLFGPARRLVRSCDQAATDPVPFRLGGDGDRGHQAVTGEVGQRPADSEQLAAAVGPSTDDQVGPRKGAANFVGAHGQSYPFEQSRAHEEIVNLP